MADSEERRLIDKVRAITFKECKDAGAQFVARTWVAERLGRSEEFVKINWNKNPYECKIDKRHMGSGGGSLNEHEKRIINLSAGRQKKVLVN